MSRIAKRRAASHEGASVDRYLALLLASPALAQLVPHLPPEVLQGVVRRCGLAACGDLLISTSPAQLNALADLDLWHVDAGRDHFDVERFGEWLEVLVDAGDTAAARAVASLDTDVVVTGLSRYLRVFDPGIFEPTAQTDDEYIDWRDAMREGDSRGALRSAVGLAGECEIGGYVIRARRPDAWDAIVVLLTTLEEQHAGTFHAVMRGCRALSNSAPELDGLDELLSVPDQHHHDVATLRERRRSQHGYAPAADARAFLAMARRESDSCRVSGKASTNAIAAEYFRVIEETGPASPDPADDKRVVRAAPMPSAIEPSLGEAMALLAKAGVLPAPPPALPAPGSNHTGAAEPNRLQRCLAYVREADPMAWLARTRELAFLANVLMSGCSLQGRAYTAREAADAAAGVCNLGMEAVEDRTDGFLVSQDLIEMFEIGWRTLHRDVTAPLIETLIMVLGSGRCGFPAIAGDLFHLRRALIRHRDAGTPWLARDQADVLGLIDLPTSAAVDGLLDECPVLPAAVPALLGGGARRVDTKAFEFFSTSAQVGDARRFIEMLPALLCG